MLTFSTHAISLKTVFHLGRVERLTLVVTPFGFTQPTPCTARTSYNPAGFYGKLMVMAFLKMGQNTRTGYLFGSMRQQPTFHEVVT